MKNILLLITTILPLTLFGQNIHVLKENETLYQLSRQYMVSVEDIIRLNNISDPASLAIGTRLVIPGDYDTYSVKKGDNLYRIARIYNLKPETLAVMNEMSISDTLFVGQKLRVPGDGSAVTQSVTTAKTHSSPRFFWPHNGQRFQLTGKLIGTQIEGSIGDPVISVSTGKVIWVEPYRGYGKLIIVESEDGMHYVYGGNKENLVQVGQAVSPGTKLGILGETQENSSAKVYFSVYKNGVPVDTAKAPRK